MEEEEFSVGEFGYEVFGIFEGKCGIECGIFWFFMLGKWELCWRYKFGRCECNWSYDCRWDILELMLDKEKRGFGEEFWKILIFRG